jgi:hypothetical protein
MWSEWLARTLRRRLPEAAPAAGPEPAAVARGVGDAETVREPGERAEVEAKEVESASA